VDSNGDGEIDK